MMSEAELHHLKHRMHTGAQHKAERGELRLALPVGLSRLPTGEVILTPDEEVQARLQLVFQQFREIRSAGGVMRYLREAHLPLPVRPLHGPAPRRSSSGKKHEQAACGIFCRTRPLREPMSMDANGSTPRNAHPHIREVG
jgi:hypothetical protein